MADQTIPEIVKNLRNLYMTEYLFTTLLDFERVLDELDLYVYDNWMKGELVAGPEVSRYSVKCTFMWPYKQMPDPAGGKRLLSHDINVAYGLANFKVPVKPKPVKGSTTIGPVKPVTVKIYKVWIVTIEMPKKLVQDIYTGTLELEGEPIDLEDLNSAYEEQLDQSEKSFEEDQ